MANTLNSLWSAFCAQLNLSPEIKGKWLGFIHSQYQRPYYDLDYLNNKLINFESCRDKLVEPDGVFLALIFQAIYYVSNATDNLERCIAEFNKFTSEAGLNEKNGGMMKVICGLIELSVTNSSEEFWEDGTFGNEDTHYFLDINFAHLAHDWDEYKSFSAKTRNEYEFLSEESYAKLRRKVLQSFLHIPNIYATSQFRNACEQKARANIQREIDELV